MPIPLSFLQNPLPREVYFDKHFGLEATKLWPGEILATREDWLLVTVTGSCVVLCLHDPVAAVGGMAHFMVPDLEAGATDTHASARYASHIMESLIDAMLLQGARRERLTALLYGGANILKGLYLGAPGERNVLFTPQLPEPGRHPTARRSRPGNDAAQNLFSAETRTHQNTWHP